MPREVQQAHDAQGDPHRELQGEAYSRGHHQVEDDDGAAHEADGQGVAEAPEDAHGGSGPTRL